jgi:hypothetical protein
MEKHSAEAFYSDLKSLIHAIRTKDEEAKQDVAHRIFQITKPWMIRRWSESKLANGNPLIEIQKTKADLVDLELTEEDEAELKTLVERYTLWGASGPWRVHRWGLACFLLVLGNTKDRKEVSGQWRDESPVETWVESLIFQRLREIFLPMLVNESAEYPESYQDYALRERHSFQKRVTKMHRPVHLLHQRQCYVVLFLTKFII